MSLHFSEETLAHCYEFAKARFEQEATRTANLKSTMAILVSTASLIIGGYAFLLGSTDYRISLLHIMLYLSYIGCLIYIIFIVRVFALFHRGFQYGYPPHTSEVIKRIEYLTDYYDTNYEKHFKKYGNQELVLQKDLVFFLTNAFGSKAELNYVTNTSKAKLLVKMVNKLLILIALVFLAFTIRTISIKTYEQERTQNGGFTIMTLEEDRKSDNDGAENESNRLTFEVRSAFTVPGTILVEESKSAGR